MNQLLLTPSDVLFFRDGRPMGGSSAGHGAAWPLPTVTNAALHASLWRSGLADQARRHSRKRGDARTNGNERFGSLTTAGPFPVHNEKDSSTWFFPRPLDADYSPLPLGSSQPHQFRLLAQPAVPLPGSASSSPLPLSVAALVPPTKVESAPWWSEGAWNSYLGSSPRGDGTQQKVNAQLVTRSDADFSDAEAMIGIGIDPSSGAQDGERFYAAHYLRLRDGWGLGMFAETNEKFDDPEKRGQREDLIQRLLASPEHILVGGQQRLCTATAEPLSANHRLPLPLGQHSNFTTFRLPSSPNESPQHLVKWVLLTPAIFPKINAGGTTKAGQPIVPHSGGWLPTWIKDDNSHQVLLRASLAPRIPSDESRDHYRARVQQQPFIGGRLVAALVGKSIPVIGWSLGTPDNVESETRTGGAKPTHFAVPAGSVYYFACDNAEAAHELATVLNWHGETSGSAICNRRSTLLGEKGFGLGVCGTWSPLTAQ